MSADIQKQLKTIKEVLLAPKPELKAVHAAAFELVNMLNQPERPIQAIISSEIIPRLLEFASHKRATAGFLAHTFIILGNLVSDDEDIIKYHLKRQHHIFIIEFIHEDASVLVLEYVCNFVSSLNDICFLASGTASARKHDARLGRGKRRYHQSKGFIPCDERVQQSQKY